MILTNISLHCVKATEVNKSDISIKNKEVDI